ncbi:hypothetical protein ACWXOO_004227 [Vibrio parahaemolyticus]|nr:hypothetical protein [Vibrio parahaemolyticus]
MKLCIALTLTALLCACSSTPPKPPEPHGQHVPVNPPDIQLQDLTLRR